MRAARGQSERAVNFFTQQFGPGKLTEIVGLCVGKRKFLPCQLPRFVPLQIPYGRTCDQYDRSNHSKGQTRDSLQTCGTRLRVRGSSLGCLYLSDLRLIALEDLLPFLAFGLLARR